jgi:hypothetical protein
VPLGSLRRPGGRERESGSEGTCEGVRCLTRSSFVTLAEFSAQGRRNGRLEKKKKRDQAERANADAATAAPASQAASRTAKDERRNIGQIYIRVIPEEKRRKEGSKSSSQESYRIRKKSLESRRRRRRLAKGKGHGGRRDRNNAKKYFL